MRVLALISIFILMITCCSFVKAQSFSGELKDANKIITGKLLKNLPGQFKQNIVIAHRGAWKNTGAPQNSIASLNAAIALGCAGSETDVHMTEDRALVINHDPEYAGLQVQKSTLEELRKTKLSNGELLPLLKDFLEIIKAQKGAKLILEIKPSQKGREWANATVQKVINIVRQMQAQAWLVYLSFDYGICKEILRLDPSANVQYLNGDQSPEQLKQDGIKGADYHFSVFKKNRKWIQSAKENSIDLNAWTVNDLKKMNWFIKKDFNFITTDEPELLFQKIGRVMVTEN